MKFWYGVTGYSHASLAAGCTSARRSPMGVCIQFSMPFWPPHHIATKYTYYMYARPEAADS